MIFSSRSSMSASGMLLTLTIAMLLCSSCTAQCYVSSVALLATCPRNSTTVWVIAENSTVLYDQQLLSALAAFPNLGAM